MLNHLLVFHFISGALSKMSKRKGSILDFYSIKRAKHYTEELLINKNFKFFLDAVVSEFEDIHPRKLLLK